MRTKILGLLTALGAVGHVPEVSAATTYGGFLNDWTSPALNRSDLAALRFGNDHYISNNVAVYAFSNAIPAGVTSVMDTGLGPPTEAAPARLMILALLGLTVARGIGRHVA